jgi:hypothetical protein
MAGSLVGVKPDTTKINEAQQKAEAAQDTFLNNLLEQDTGDSPAPAPKDGQPETPTDGRVRDDKGRFLKADGSADESTEPEKPDAAPVKVSKAETEEYRRAVQALKFDKVPESVLDAMDPKEVIRWGLDRAKNHSDIDRIKTRNAELEKAAKAAAKEAPTGQPDPMAEHVKAFAEMFGEEAGAVFANALKANQPKSQSDQDSERFTKLEGELMGLRREGSRKALAEHWKRYGVDLTDLDNWNQVLTHRQADINSYDSEDEALQVAVRHVFAEQALAASSAKVKQSHEARSKGQPMTETKSRETPAPRSTGDLEDELLNALQDGEEQKVHQIARQLGRSPGIRSLGEIARTG